MNLAEEFHPCPKPKHSRNKPTAKQRGAITTAVRDEVKARSGEHCECCGKHKSQVWTLEMAHITRRWAIQGKTTSNDIAHLCGPSTDSSTCHHWVDYTAEGRKWLRRFGELLKLKYTQ